MWRDPASDERDPVRHAVGSEHPLRDVRDVACLDGVDVPGARPSRGDGEYSAPGADVEHDISRAYRCNERSKVVARPAVVVQHPGVLDGVGPSARRRPARVRANEGAFLDQHVDNVHRGREVRGGCLPLETVDRLA